jgi:thioredoxin 1
MLTLTDYYADWCGPCRAMEPILENILKEYEGKVILERIDVDQNQSKAAEAGVMGIPTLVMSKDESEVDRKTGLLPEPVLKQWIDSNLG